MAKTTKEIDSELVLYKCCFADKALEYLQKEIYGFQDLECRLNKLILMEMLIKRLSCHVTILELTTLTQTELEETLEKLNDLCGCVNCQDLTDLTDDTLPTGLSSAFD